MRDAMSPREFRSLHTRRRSLSIAPCGKDRLLLLMVSITLPSLRQYLEMNWIADYKCIPRIGFGCQEGKYAIGTVTASPTSACSEDSASRRPSPRL
jgi:hypothetical protein